MPGGVVGTDSVFIRWGKARATRVFAEVEERCGHDGEVAYNEGDAALYTWGKLSSIGIRREERWN